MTSNNQSRRQFIQRGLIFGSAAWGSSALWTPGVMAEELTLTPAQDEGPFYPNRLPLDTDNDLLIINDKLTPAVGEVAHVGGRVLSTSGEPMAGVVVEIWQVDNNGVYLHTGSDDRENFDTNFQGYGRFLTNRKGEYYFRTVKPVAYGPRAPHIHFAVSRGDRKLLTTQCYVKNEPINQRDPLLTRIEDLRQRQSVIANFRPLKKSRTGELMARFDIVLGFTPEG